MLLIWNVFRFICFCGYSNSLPNPCWLYFNFFEYKAFNVVPRVKPKRYCQAFCPVPIPPFFASHFRWVTDVTSFWFILPGFLYSLRNRYTDSYFLISAYFLYKEYHIGRCYFALCFFHLKMYPENYSVSAHGSLSFSCLRLHAMCWYTIVYSAKISYMAL